MATTCEMMVEENDIELSLGLSLGGCFRKSEKSLGIQQKSLSSSGVDEKSSGEIEADLRSSMYPISGAVFGEKKEVEIEGEVLDPQRKREIQALRRQEARKKREEKQQKKGRVRDRESIENETSRSEQICKLVKVSDGDDQQDVNQPSEQSQSPNPSSAFAPVVPMQYSFPQYIPFTNGFPIPYAVPYWSAPPPPPSASIGDEKNVFQLVACRAFRPFQEQNSNANQNRSGSYDSEQNGSKCDGVKQLQSSLCSSGSLGSGSSGVSDYQSTSHQGGCSRDMRSHSSRSESEQPQLHTMVVNNAQEQTEHSASSQPTEPTQGIEEPEQKAEKMGSLSPSSQTNPGRSEGKPITTTDNLPPRSPTRPPQPPRETKGEANKPPKPPQPQHPKTQSLPHMPCVSTTGNGPNGKTITGFLYRYSKTEVSIMCVCHGSLFTPAEFVKHAGGTDVSHPLKHIVVVPSTF
ncbi:zinc finger CCCH domain-containing protein 18-like [Macadamia integrifolia]|uniref:zinc finger CCCH domain-containing protein 18-like n=1 Tax=Macadamia integrifolia TaxID=60698 RepID=UPI001C4E90AE|nr:zinc finger CCCH domain-containing protein 18-like [Macadamia integrifolia]